MFESGDGFLRRTSLASMDIRSLNNASWNIFRYIGDYLHDAAVVFLLCQACCRRSVAGLSLRTQCIYLTLYVSRYLDLFDHLQSAYLVFHKIYFISTALKDADTCPALTFALLALCLAPWSAAEDTAMEILWTWSQSLEGFAMVPQYVCSYRNAVSGAAEETVLFLLFGVSCLRRATLTVDDGLHAVGEDLRERFGGCLLSPGQRYLEIAPTQGMEMNSAYAPPTTFGAATE
eukprot:s1944_g2.t1